MSVTHRNVPVTEFGKRWSQQHRPVFVSAEYLKAFTLLIPAGSLQERVKAFSLSQTEVQLNSTVTSETGVP